MAVSMLGGCASETSDKAEGDAGTSRVDSILGTTSEPSSTEVKLNPPHGEPGHRCEIPVGAPLNSAPSASGEPNLTITPTPGQATQPNLNIAPQPNVASGVDPNLSPAEMLAKGLNPPHGAEGHKCEIAVGAPLN